MGHFIRFDVLLLQPGHSPAVCPRCTLGCGNLWIRTHGVWRRRGIARPLLPWLRPAIVGRNAGTGNGRME